MTRKYTIGVPFDVTQWPQSTSIACWHCTHSFDGLPMVLPVRMRRVNDKCVYYAIGTFCSLACASAYNLYVLKNEKAFSLLHTMAKQFFGKSSKRGTKTAPPKEVLQKFGGDMAIAEFRGLEAQGVRLEETPYIIPHEKVLQAEPRFTVAKPCGSANERLTKRPVFYAHNYARVKASHDASRGYKVSRTKAVKKKGLERYMQKAKSAK